MSKMGGKVTGIDIMKTHLLLDFFLPIDIELSLEEISSEMQPCFTNERASFIELFLNQFRLKN
jgi:hypothetical protein